MSMIGYYFKANEDMVWKIKEGSVNGEGMFHGPARLITKEEVLQIAEV